MLRLSAEVWLDYYFFAAINCWNSSLLSFPSPFPSNFANTASICSLLSFFDTWSQKAVSCAIVLLRSGMSFRKMQSVSGIRTDLSKFFPCDEAVSILVKELEGSLCLWRPLWFTHHFNLNKIFRLCKLLPFKSGLRRDSFLKVHPQTKWMF